MAQPTGASALDDLIPAFRDELCLDFANTRYWRGTETPTEELGGIGDVVAWCKSAGLISEPAAEGARRWWDEQPDRGAAAFLEAIALREAIATLQSNPTRRAELAQAGRARVLTNFTHTRIAAENSEFFKQVLAA